MSAEAFLDTNVVLYAFAADDQRQLRAEALLAGGCVISVQVLNEFAAVSRRKHGRSWPEILNAREAIRTLSRRVVDLSVEVHDRGAALAERHRLGIYDGCILAAALEAGCRVIYSEDMHDGLLVEGRLRVVNPFRATGLNEA